MKAKKKFDVYERNCDFMSDEMCNESLEEIGIEREEAEGKHFNDGFDAWEN